MNYVFFLYSMPFDVKDWKVGFHYNNILKLTKELPSKLFFKRTFPLSDIAGSDAAGTATFNSHIDPNNKRINVDISVNNDEGTFNVNAGGSLSSKEVDELELSFSTKSIKDGLTLASGFNYFNKKLFGSAAYDVYDTTSVKLTLDNVDMDPVVSVAHKIDDHNMIKPTLSLKTYGLNYQWLRKWNGGNLETTWYPNDKIELNWSDDAKDGKWNTKVVIPQSDTSKTQVSVKRNWEL